MGRSKWVPIGVVVLCIPLLVVVFVLKSVRSSDSGGSFTVAPLPAEEMAILHRQIVDAGKDFISADGMKVYFPVNTEDRPPIEEIIFLEVSPIARDLNGNFHSVESASTLMFTSKTNAWGGIFDLVSPNGVVVGLTEKPVPGALLIGAEYTVEPLERGRRIGLARLKLPEDVVPGKIYHVDLLVRDEIELRAQQERELARRKQQQLVVKITESAPSWLGDDGMWGITYRDVVTGHWIGPPDYDESSPPTLPAEFTFEGIETLGGELAVLHAKHRESVVAWLYMGAISKRTVSLPQEASFVFDEADAVDVVIQIEGSDLTSFLNRPDGYSRLGFYHSSEAQMPLVFIFGSGFIPSSTGAGTATRRLRMMPGHYYVRATYSKDETASIAELDIQKETGRTYIVTLPDPGADEN